MPVAMPRSRARSIIELTRVESSVMPSIELPVLCPVARAVPAAAESVTRLLTERVVTSASRSVRSKAFGR